MNDLLNQIFLCSGIDIYAICMLLIILLSLRHSGYLIVRSQRIFLKLLLSVIILLFIEIITRRVNGLPYHWAYLINNISNTLLFVGNPLPTFLWLIYLHIQVFGEDAKFPIYQRLIALLVLIHALFSVLSPFYGFIFHIDDTNIYHRGPLYPTTAFLNFMFIIIPLTVLLINRKIISKRNFFSLLAFSILPLFGAIIQISNYNITLIWSSAALSILIAFIYIQNRLVNQDYLTGLANRRQLDNYINKKLNESVHGNSFSLLMMDLNDFKKINDEFGHTVGDEALESTAALISSKLRKNDFIGRYAGDEFVAVLNTTDIKNVESTVGRIKEAFTDFNNTGISLYKLELSIGYLVYDPEKPQKLKTLQSSIDARMYQDKKRS